MNLIRFKNCRGKMNVYIICRVLHMILFFHNKNNDSRHELIHCSCLFIHIWVFESQNTFHTFLFSISMGHKRMTEAARQEMDDLNIKCLQLLRAMVHNEERKMPEDWETRTTEHKIKKLVLIV